MWWYKLAYSLSWQINQQCKQVSVENDYYQERGWQLGEAYEAYEEDNSGGMISKGSTTGSSTGNTEK